uniref:Putative ovule protein n=1 Tax=Solanum chacoense TaxID=4108 RepID=A0A0V0H8N2_SOLCH
MLFSNNHGVQASLRAPQLIPQDTYYYPTNNRYQVTLFTKARTYEKRSPIVFITVGFAPETSWCSTHFIDH